MSVDLIKALVDQLGVSDQQAKGGAGLLFKFAKDKLSSQDFSQISNVIPEVNQLMSSVPSDGGGLMGMLTKVLGGKAGDLAGLAGGFSKLGLDANMVQKFVPILLNVIQQKGGSGVAGILQQVLKN